MSEKRKYITLKPISYKGKYTGVGDEVSLTDSEAAKVGGSVKAKREETKENKKTKFKNKEAK